jgi:lysophospholipase L1-like esterase
VTFSECCTNVQRSVTVAPNQSSSTSPTPPLTWRTKLFLSVGVPILFLSLLEIGARIAAPALAGDSKVDFEMPTWMARDENLVARVGSGRTDPRDVDWWSMFESAPGFRVRLVPNTVHNITNTFSLIPSDRRQTYQVRSNSLGFRGEEPLPSKADDSIQIAIFGDSSSFGWGVNEEDTFGIQLRTRLKKAHPNQEFEVLNFGIPGDSSAYGRLIAERFIPELSPDIVIIAFGANDAKLVYTPHTAQVERFRAGKTLQTLRTIARESALYRLLESITAATPKQSAAPTKVVAVSRVEYERNLRTMVKIAHESGARRSLIMTVCTPGDYAKSAARAARKSRASFLNAQALLIKSIPALKSGEQYPALVAAMKEQYPEFLLRDDLFYVSSDLCHPNVVGHAIIADRLAELLEKHLAEPAAAPPPSTP